MNRTAMAGVSLLALCAAETSSSNWMDLSSGWCFMPDNERQGELAQWYAVSHADADWTPVDAGVRWEDQGFP